jgi:bifunctional UDP-N-acetylglucosamine pyrophosphorylase/glucosamine-1-phosphate N-acetyltransferase
MSSKITVVIWQSSHRYDFELFGQPLWHSCLAKVRKLRPQRILLVLPSTSSEEDVENINDVETVRPERLSEAMGHSRNKVILLAPELACIQSRTLRRLLTTTKGNRCLEAVGTGQHAPAFSSTMGEVHRALDELPAGGGLDSLLSRLKPAVAVHASVEELIQVRTPAEWSQAVRVLRRRKAEKLLDSGVFIEDPSNVCIDPDVRVGRGTRIGGWVVIEGESRVGANCNIGPYTHIVDCDVGAGTIVLDHCFVRSSRIGKRAQIGPFAHVRPDSVIGDQAKVGNFVELKKTTLGRGAKAPHLTYLGDATVGGGANVGAGTITCNYDGRSKHQTVIGDGAFIGSDVQLVAPVRVGKGAYVAAGSCIVEDVPAKSLALARSRQVVKRGWVNRKNK